MAGVGPGDLQDLAQDFLDACVAALDSIPAAPAALPLDGAPSRAFVTAGRPAFDCCGGGNSEGGQLTVNVDPITEAPTAPGGLGAGTRHKQGARINHVALVATIIRCVPVPSSSGALPTIAAMEAAAEQINADGWALWNHVWNRIRSELLFAKCSGVFWEGLRPIQPQGGCAGWTLHLRVELEGYEETL